MAPTLEKLVFLTYLTNYNIQTIYYCLEKSIGGSLEELATLALQKGSPEMRDDKSVVAKIEAASATTRETIDRLKFLNIKTSLFTDTSYPTLLHDLKDKPPILYYKGKLPRRKALAAVVGSRETSYNAEAITDSLVDKLVSCNYGIVSGLALGIDTFAHRRALQRKCYTMAVMPNSLERIYPTENYKLAEEILAKNGSLVSELAFGINRGKVSFVQRNRIQSGLSNTVVPVEMGAKSGTMHTMDFAMRQHRNVFLMRRREYTKYNEGIKVLLDKYGNGKYDNVYIINSMTDFLNKLTLVSGGSSIGIQGEMF